jgi:succinate dehydrogenase/fumarate reductase flavoprotein subunit
MRRLEEQFRAGRSICHAEAFSLGKIRKIMWEEAGMLRNEIGLSRSLESLREILSLSKPGSNKTPDPACAEAVELRLAAQAACLVVEAALRRKESRGSHFREDYPEQNDRQWLGHLQVERSAPRGDEWKFAAS